MGPTLEPEGVIPVDVVQVTTTLAPSEFEDYYRINRDKLVRALTIVLGDHTGAAAAVDEGMLRTVDRWKAVRGAPNALGWTLRASLRWVRQRHGSTIGPRSDAAGDSDPAVAAAFWELSLPKRSALVGRYYLKLSPTEVGVAVGATGRKLDELLSLDPLARRAGDHEGDIGPRLLEFFTEIAQRVPPPTGSIESLMSRERHHRTATMLGVGLVSLGLISVAALAIATANRRPTEPVVVAPPAIPAPTAAITAREYRWAPADLPLARGPSAAVVGVAEIDGNLFALTNSFTRAASPVQVWKSADGRDWELLAAEGFPPTARIEDLVATGSQLWAAGTIAESPGLPPGTPAAWSSQDGEVWQPAELGARASAFEAVAVHHLHASDYGVVMGGTRYRFEPPAPIVLSRDGYRLELDDASWTFTLTDDAGVLVAGGSQDLLFPEAAATGLTWVNPADGSLLEFRGSELVFAYGGTAGGAETVELEKDGRRIVLRGFSYTVEDSATGEQLERGATSDLLRGVPPRFSDPETGELLLFTTWPLLDAARTNPAPVAGESPASFLFFSEDGNEWIQPDIDLAGVLIDAVAMGPDGLLVALNSEPLGPDFELWQFAGDRWRRNGSLGDARFIRHLTVAGDRYVAVGVNSRGSGVWSSPDGSDWAQEMSVADSTQPNTRLSKAIEGGSGTVALGSAAAFRGSDPAVYVAQREGVWEEVSMAGSPLEQLLLVSAAVTDGGLVVAGWDLSTSGRPLPYSPIRIYVGSP